MPDGYPFPGASIDSQSSQSGDELNYLAPGSSDDPNGDRPTGGVLAGQVVLTNTGTTMKNRLGENPGFIIFLLCFGFFRMANADWNPIPSGSMRPTLLEADVDLVNRLAYDFKRPLTDIGIAHLAEPRRGDIVTFSSPNDGTRLIKRVVAPPGDRIELRDDVLLINGEVAMYEHPSLVREPLEHRMELDAVHGTERVAGFQHAIQLLPAVQARRNFGPMMVPAGSYFMMGDNLDNSADSRYFGAVPRHLLIGRAHRVLVSADSMGDRWRRFARTGEALR